MINKRILSILLFFICLAKISLSDYSHLIKECILLNKKYNYYLYASNIWLSKSKERSVYSWEASLIFQVRNLINSNDEKGIWYLEKLDKHNKTYLIRNKLYNEYMYAGQTKPRFFVSVNKDDIRLFTKGQPVNLDLSYMWRFEQIKYNTYSVWNLKYEAPINVESELSFMKMRRNVLVKKDKSNILANEWNLACLTDEKKFVDWILN